MSDADRGILSGFNLRGEGGSLRQPGQIIGKPAFASVADVSYLSVHDASVQCTDTANILGVIGFGTERPDFLPPICAFLPAPLAPIGGGAMLELWRTPSPCRPINFGPVTGAYSDHLAFGAITLDEKPGLCLEATAETAYLAIFDFLDQTGFSTPLRFWNYLSEITQETDGLERYRRFNIGRHRAFCTRLQEPLPPAASGVGGTHGASVIYFLAARDPARPIENPRQISAFAYPPLYGPQSPSFSRASIYQSDSSTVMFISGTASIVGHESLHPGDLNRQTEETIANLQALIDAAGITGLGNWSFKIYLRDPAYHATVDSALIAAFGPASERLHLHGEICRRELLLEIEAFCRVR